MKISISYFYNIRFMKPNQIPISTAAWDPKWFHRNCGKGHMFLDINGVLNGARIDHLSPENLPEDCVCCPCELHKKLPEGTSCKFLDGYREYLNSLNFSSVIEELIDRAKHYSKEFNLPDPEEVVLIVYETPDNPCSERVELIRWFKENGVELKEWSKN